MSKVGDVIHTQTFKDIRGDLYWFQCSTTFRAKDGIPPDAALRGPFKTEREVEEDQRKVLLGPQCEVTPGGAWNPNWDKPQ